ncbi:MAG: serine/threonine-protein kinase [Lentisphaeria bacterium]
MEQLPTGKMVDEFRINGVIGEGAMAIVYQATQTSLDRPVALKVLPRDFSQDKEYVDRFFNEARAAAMLSHANIVQVYDAGVAEDDICYLAMEYIEGEPLSDRIDVEGYIPASAALRIGLEIARALNYGWEKQGLTHGDIKPANILITKRGESKLADFGLAKINDLEEEEEEQGIMLTPLYASPETIKGERLSDRCSGDIYSFGATLYHMMTGAPPFPDEDAEEVMRRQLEEPLTPARDQNIDIPNRVSAFLGLLLKKDPNKRPQTWGEIVTRMGGLLQGTTRKRPAAKKAARAQHKVKVAHPVTIKKPRRFSSFKRFIYFALVLIAASLIVALILWIIVKHG